MEALLLSGMGSQQVRSTATEKTLILQRKGQVTPCQAGPPGEAPGLVRRRDRKLGGGGEPLLWFFQEEMGEAG